MRIMIEAKPTHIYDERAFTVTVWFISKLDALKYKAEPKYNSKFTLLPNVTGDASREGDYKFCRVYQIKPKYV